MAATAYKVKTDKGKAVLVMVESSRAAPRARNAGLPRLLDGAEELGGQLENVAALAKAALGALQAAAPGKIELEFGVELGGEAGVPLVTKGTAKANFKVVLTWSDSRQEG
jgi:hypothetical protein